MDRLAEIERRLGILEGKVNNGLEELEARLDRILLDVVREAIECVK